MITINVHYYAQLREAAGREEENVDLNEGANAQALYHLLSQRHGFGLDLSNVRVAINDEFAPFDRILVEGDKVVFIPPVSGG